MQSETSSFQYSISYVDFQAIERFYVGDIEATF